MCRRGYLPADVLTSFFLLSNLWKCRECVCVHFIQNVCIYNPHTHEIMFVMYRCVCVCGHKPVSQHVFMILDESGVHRTIANTGRACMLHTH